MISDPTFQALDEVAQTCHSPEGLGTLPDAPVHVPDANIVAESDTSLVTSGQSLGRLARPYVVTDDMSVVGSRSCES
jgi:hypothetical protein